MPGATLALHDKSGAIFGSLLLLLTLAVLVGTSTIGVEVWEVTVPPALIMLGRDAWVDWRQWRAGKNRRGEYGSGGTHQGTDDGLDGTAERQIRLERIKSGAQLATVEDHDVPGLPQRTTLTTFLSPHVSTLQAIFPTVHTIAQRLPLPLLPFAFMMFILVQGLASKGWVEVFGGWWGVWVAETGVVGAVFGMVGISGVLCNVHPHLLRLPILLTLHAHERSLKTTIDLRYKHRNDHPSRTNPSSLALLHHLHRHTLQAPPIRLDLRPRPRLELRRFHFHVRSFARGIAVEGYIKAEGGYGTTVRYLISTFLDVEGDVGIFG